MRLFFIQHIPYSYFCRKNITQLQWQRSEDPHGNPFLAIVIDPLRSLAKGRPELMSFRVYPPDYNPPLNQTPDGTFVTDDRLRVEKWGKYCMFFNFSEVYFLEVLQISTITSQIL